VYRYNPRRRRRAIRGHVLTDERTERRRQRVRWRRLLIVALLLAAVVGAVALYRSPLLRVREVEVIGAKNLSAEQVAKLADLEGTSMFRAPLDEAEARIVELPFVKAAKATLRWPDKVRIEVIERTPWGYWELAGKSYVIDTDGVILADVKPPEGAPLIHDLGDPAQLSPGDTVDTDAVALARALLTFVPEQLSLNVVQLEYAPERGLSLTTNANYRVVMGDSQNVEYKMAVWKAVEKELGRETMAGHVLDLRFRDRPAFQ
jgi:cell division protein FtsQ